jgi:hypothetical protein
VLDKLYTGIPLPLQPITEKHLSKSERNSEICEHFSSGDTLDEIADDFDLSHQRVHEIVRRWCK